MLNHEWARIGPETVLTGSSLVKSFDLPSPVQPRGSSLIQSNTVFFLLISDTNRLRFRMPFLSDHTHHPQQVTSSPVPNWYHFHGYRFSHHRSVTAPIVIGQAAGGPDFDSITKQRWTIEIDIVGSWLLFFSITTTTATKSNHWNYFCAQTFSKCEASCSFLPRKGGRKTNAKTNINQIMLIRENKSSHDLMRPHITPGQCDRTELVNISALWHKSDTIRFQLARSGAHLPFAWRSKSRHC